MTKREVGRITLINVIASEAWQSMSEADECRHPLHLPQELEAELIVQNNEQ